MMLFTMCELICSYTHYIPYIPYTHYTHYTHLACSRKKLLQFDDFILDFIPAYIEHMRDTTCYIRDRTRQHDLYIRVLTLSLPFVSERLHLCLSLFLYVRQPTSFQQSPENSSSTDAIIQSAWTTEMCVQCVNEWYR